MKPKYGLLLGIAMLVCTMHTLDAQKQSNQMLCQGDYWTQGEAYDFLKEIRESWNIKEEWEKRAIVIRRGIIEGMKLDRMPAEREPVGTVIINSTREMDGYIVENVAIESFPGFYITGNLYRPVSDSKRTYAGILCPHGHWRNKGN